jgi:hypothetical protein
MAVKAKFLVGYYAHHIPDFPIRLAGRKIEASWASVDDQPARESEVRLRDHAAENQGYFSVVTASAWTPLWAWGQLKRNLRGLICLIPLRRPSLQGKVAL